MPNDAVTVFAFLKAPPKPSTDKTIIVGGNTEIKLKQVPDINGPIRYDEVFQIS